MNNRLQVGGLALTLDSKIQKSNIGLVVKIVKNVSENYSDGKDWWHVENAYLKSKHGKTIGYGNFPSHKLMPLGDKQIQDELAKEKELENV